MPLESKPSAEAQDDQLVDLLVIGAGAGGMTAALVGALGGLDVLLCEKTEMVGGTTATSAGSVWIPGSSQSKAAGLADSIEDAETYLNAVVGPVGNNAMRAAYLASGPAMLDELEAQTDVQFIPASPHPDYHQQPGAAKGGRALGAAPFDGRKLGKDFARVRAPRAEFMVLGGMMVGKSDIPFLLAPFASKAAFKHAAGLLLRYLTDRLRFRRGTRLVMGNALVARLFASLRGRNVAIDFGTRIDRLIVEGDRVAGAVVSGPRGTRHVRARRGTVLATGGIGWNGALRAELFPKPAQRFSMSPQTNTGDGLTAARRIGGRLADGLDSAGLWMPSSVLERADGAPSVFPHIVLDRAKPGLIAVNRAGRRFVNEANSYHDFVAAMLRTDPVVPSIPAYLICDRSFIHDYGIGLIHPRTRDLQRFLKAGYLLQGDTVAALAARIKVDADGLMQTIRDHNEFAATGIDAEFGRGASDLNRVNGDPANTPNPCLRPIGPGPYFAVAVWPADLASSVGLQTDEDARVLDGAGLPIAGLYAVGADAASIFRGTYPGPGTVIGPAMTFAWRAARHAAGKSLE
jgi:3-oxosteroid 1-dehydrogenase